MKAIIVPSIRGLGHVTRCRALANELTERGWEASISGGYAPPGTDADVVVIDGKEFGAEMYDWKVPSVCIRDTMPDRVPGGRAEDFPGSCVLVVVPTAHSEGACAIKYDQLFVDVSNQVHNRGRVVYGPGLSMLRREFRWRHCAPPVPRTGVWDCRKIDSFSPGAVAEAMSRAAVVITYGGMRAMEAACCGAPMVVYARNEGEALNATGLQSSGAAVALEYEPNAYDVAKELMAKPKVREEMSERALKVVDGLGCYRVAEAIEEVLR